MYPVYFFIGIVLMIATIGFVMVVLNATKKIDEQLYRLVRRRLVSESTAPTKSEKECSHQFQLEYDSGCTTAYDWCPICHMLMRKK